MTLNKLKKTISDIESLTDQVQNTSSTLMVSHKKSGSPENANKIEQLRRATVEEDLPRSIQCLQTRLSCLNRSRPRPAPIPSSHNIHAPQATSDSSDSVFAPTVTNVSNSSVPDLASTSLSNDSVSVSATPDPTINIHSDSVTTVLNPPEDVAKLNPKASKFVPQTNELNTLDHSKGTEVKTPTSVIAIAPCVNSEPIQQIMYSENWSQAKIVGTSNEAVIMSPRNFSTANSLLSDANGDCADSDSEYEDSMSDAYGGCAYSESNQLRRDALPSCDKVRSSATKARNPDTIDEVQSAEPSARSPEAIDPVRSAEP